MTLSQTHEPFDLGVRAFRPGDVTNGHEEHETVVVGGGQAGLCVAYHLKRRSRQCVILDENAGVGDNWRNAWDSLRLFTPARYDGLPGMRFPAPRHSFPTRDQMAAFLKEYATRFELPVRSGIFVDSLSRDAEGFVVTAGDRQFHAQNVVVATGPQHLPRVPAFADELDAGITQLHSSEYRNPSQLSPGPVLVVGASHSGPDIALETAPDHETILSGAYVGEIPFDIEGRPARAIVPILWRVANHVLTIKTPIGRKVRPHIRFEGGPLIRVKAKDLEAAGVEHVDEKTVGVRDGRPVLADGRVLDVANVIWCTGFRLDFTWIDLPVIQDDGYPAEARGVVPSTPGLYFAGLLFQYSFASMLIGGVGRDADYVAKHITARMKARSVA
jgi:putative flavoprotein involved in K+ transport